MVGALTQVKETVTFKKCWGFLHLSFAIIAKRAAHHPRSRIKSQQRK